MGFKSSCQRRDGLTGGGEVSRFSAVNYRDCSHCNRRCGLEKRNRSIWISKAKFLTSAKWSQDSDLCSSISKVAWHESKRVLPSRDQYEENVHCGFSTVSTWRFIEQQDPRPNFWIIATWFVFRFMGMFHANFPSLIDIFHTLWCDLSCIRQTGNDPQSTSWN
jgi:hypothetical protein